MLLVTLWDRLGCSFFSSIASSSNFNKNSWTQGHSVSAGIFQCLVDLKDPAEIWSVV